VSGAVREQATREKLNSMLLLEHFHLRGECNGGLHEQMDEHAGHAQTSA